MKIAIKILLIILSAFFLPSCGTGGSHPSDAEMLRNFNENREKFKKLVSMIHADEKLLRVDDNWTHPSNPSTIGVSAARIAEYRSLFAQCGIPRGFEGFHKEQGIQFIATAFGLATGGSSKGYAFLFSPPSANELVESLDSNRPKNKQFYTVYNNTFAKMHLGYFLTKKSFQE